MSRPIVVRFLNILFIYSTEKFKTLTKSYRCSDGRPTSPRRVRSTLYGVLEWSAREDRLWRSEQRRHEMAIFPFITWNEPRHSVLFRVYSNSTGTTDSTQPHGRWPLWKNHGVRSLNRRDCCESFRTGVLLAGYCHRNLWWKVFGGT